MPNKVEGIKIMAAKMFDFHASVDLEEQMITRYIHCWKSDVAAVFSKWTIKRGLHFTDLTVTRSSFTKTKI